MFIDEYGRIVFTYLTEYGYRRIPNHLSAYGRRVWGTLPGSQDVSGLAMVEAFAPGLDIKPTFTHEVELDPSFTTHLALMSNIGGGGD